MTVLLERLYWSMYKDQQYQIAVRFNGSLSTMTTDLHNRLDAAFKNSHAKANTSNG